MNPEDYPKIPAYIRVLKLNQADLMQFVGRLHEVQMDMIEESLATSNMQESKDVIKYIMEKN
jgi:hypothetical protein